MIKHVWRCLVVVLGLCGLGCDEPASQQTPCVGVACCGNGRLDAGETCDDGAANSDSWAETEHCNATCTGNAAFCGDGQVTVPEVCDDANANSNVWALDMHCNADCTAAAPYCGDGILDADELCDEGSFNSDAWSASAHCNATCGGLAPYCGDAFVDAVYEVCDDGAANNDAWTATPHCNASCSDQAPTCDSAENTSVVFPRSGVAYPPENPHSYEKMVLGKILFWEEQMSSDNTVACGTCHQPAAGGADPRSLSSRHPGPDNALNTVDDPHGSAGIKRCQIDANGEIQYVNHPVFGSNSQVTSRRAPSFMDAMLTQTLFWDGRATSQFVVPDTLEVAIVAGGALESQAVGPPVSSAEMACEGRTWADVLAKLADAEPLDLAGDLPPDVANAICKYPSYPQLFAWAFGDPDLSTQRVAFAIATYERTLLSDDSAYHRFLAGDATALTAAQQNGMFELTNSGSTAKCVRCHKTNQQFAGDRFSNLGFSASTWDGGATGIADFRVPTLMNVALREGTPGAFRGLLHDGVGAGANLDTIMVAYNNPPVPPGGSSNTDVLMTPLTLNSTQIANILDFMRNGLTDSRAANENYPFDRPKLSTEP